MGGLATLGINAMHRAPFPYFGGKYRMLKWLLPLLPQTKHYCELFGGSGIVLLNREPSTVETYNDVDGILVNFFQVLRDHPNALLRLLSLTPYSRWEYITSIASNQYVASSVELARLFYIDAKMSFSGGGKHSSPGHWSHSITYAARCMPSTVSKWLSSVDEVLPYIIHRLRTVQIECNDALRVIDTYDDKDTLFYCDPPYPVSGVAYRYECTDGYHVELANKLCNAMGLVAVSGYHCDLLDNLYSGWVVHEYPVTSAASVGKGGEGHRLEVVWTNYEWGTQ